MKVNGHAIIVDVGGFDGFLFFIFSLNNDVVIFWSVAGGVACNLHSVVYSLFRSVANCAGDGVRGSCGVSSCGWVYTMELTFLAEFAFTDRV